jgi:DNA adenine methylase
MPFHTVYVEPFGGGGAVLLRKPRSKVEVYNDLDGEIVNVFRVLRDRPDELVRKVDLTPYAREELELACQASEDDVERARRTVVRSFFGFGPVSVFVSGRVPSFSVDGPDSAGCNGAVGWSGYPDVLLAIVDRLKGVTVENRDAFGLMPGYDSPGACFYVDPPYVRSTRQSGTYRYEFTDDQHKELSRVLKGLRGAVLLSGYPSGLYDELYRGWDRYEREAFTVFNCGGDPVRTEVLWVKGAR